MDASEIRTAAGSLQLDRRNPDRVVFYNLRPGPDDVLSWPGGRGKEDLSGRLLAGSGAGSHPARLSVGCLERTNALRYIGDYVRLDLVSLIQRAFRIQRRQHRQQQQQQSRNRCCKVTSAPS